MKKPKRKRAPGAGRKPISPNETRVVRSFSISPRTLAVIEREAALRKLPVGRVVDEIVTAW